jgi:hypothetical protein
MGGFVCSRWFHDTVLARPALFATAAVGLAVISVDDDRKTTAPQCWQACGELPPAARENPVRRLRKAAGPAPPRIVPLMRFSMTMMWEFLRRIARDLTDR